MARKRRSLKILGLAVVVVLAFSAVAASAASAAHQWTIESSKLLASESVEVDCKSSTGFVLTSVIGEINLELKATGVDCVESKLNGPETDSGKLTFTGVTVVKPKNCTVPGGDLTTNALKTTLLEDPSSTHGFDLFEPASGTEFVNVTLAGGTCTVAGSYPIKGSIAGEGEVWGTQLVEQPLKFSPTIDTTTGHNLTFGGNPATMTGTALNTLIGTWKGSSIVGKKFGADK